MQTTFSYYEILGVSQTANIDDIKAAYRAAMLKYHPDVNTAPNAQRLTEIIIDAYGVLSDPAKRRAYDTSIAAGDAQPEPGEESESIWDFFACDGCGRVDVHSRCATFFKVFSIIFYSQAKPVGGVLCPECRSRVAISSALFSAFLGPWGFWGLFYTLRSLFASLRGGELPRQQNAQLLRHQGIAFLQRGFINEARTALVASLRFEHNPQVLDLLNEERFRVSTVFPAPGWSKGQTVAAFLFAVPPILVLALLWMLGSNSAGSSATTSDYSGSQAQDAQLTAMLGTCKTASDRAKDARAAYNACNAALKWIANDLAATPRAADRQEYSLVTDNTLIYKSYASERLGWPDQAKTEFAQGTADWKSLTSNGVTQDIRATAKRNYQCAVLDKC
jgi:hypothetical protein